VGDPELFIMDGLLSGIAVTKNPSREFISLFNMVGHTLIPVGRCWPVTAGNKKVQVGDVAVHPAATILRHADINVVWSTVVTN